MHPPPHCLTELMREVSARPGRTVQQDKHVVAPAELVHPISPPERWVHSTDRLCHGTSAIIVAADIEMVRAAPANVPKDDWVRACLSCEPLHNLSVQIG